MPHASNENASGGPKRLFLFTSPRTASHLMMKMLSLDKQPDLEYWPPETAEYFFMSALGIYERLGQWHKHGHTITDEDKASCMEVYQLSADNMASFIQKAEASNKRVFIKEHVSIIMNPVARSKMVDAKNNTIKYSPWTVSICGNPPTLQSPLNETLFPDDFLLTLSPTFLLRHPALMFESQYRNWTELQTAVGGEAEVQNNILETIASMRPVRNLYDFYKRHFEARGESIWPIVIDASDIIQNPDVLKEYCKTIGLETSKMVSEWEAYEIPDGEDFFVSTAIKQMLITVAGSKGLVKDKAPTDINIDNEAKAWRHKFGEDAGAMIERWVRDAMPDYEYLRSKRLGLGTGLV